MSWKVYVLVAAIVAGAVGFVAGALVLSENEHGDSRGTIVRLGGVEGLQGFPEEPWCSEFHQFCLVQLPDGELRALYTYETHAYFRARGCTAPWRAEFPFENTVGWFRAGCGGTTYDMTGKRVFGPGARDMDRFQVTLRLDPTSGRELIEIDTRVLICGAGLSPETSDCEKAPLRE